MAGDYLPDAVGVQGVQNELYVCPINSNLYVYKKINKF